MHPHDGSGDEARERQVQAERSQREAARGQRARAVLRGDLGPVLKRWAAGAVLPTSSVMRQFSEHYLRGEVKQAGAILSSPVFGLSEVTEEHHKGELRILLQWGLKGDHMEDLALAVVGTAMVLCASSLGAPEVMDRKRGHKSLAATLSACADAARETAMGQFIMEVQGADAMVAVRKGKEHTWQERARMDAIGALLAGQARSALGDDTGESHVGGREVVTVIGYGGQARRLELRRPEPGDWDLLEMARRPKGEADPFARVWRQFALMALCASQRAAGLFGLVSVKSKRGETKALCLSPEAMDAIGDDLDKWLSLGFIAAPMLVEPESGDYLTVKHRRVAGARGPKGVRTDATGTWEWDAAAAVMAATPWTVAPEAISFARSEAGRPYVERSEAVPGHREMVLGAAARLAGEPRIYLPVYMDFRGRVYYRPSLVTLQGSDLQKSLMTFPKEGAGRDDLDADAEECLISHVAGLYGGPGKLDKAPFGEREAWWYDASGRPVEELLEEADEPLQLHTALTMIRSGQADRVACQIDGTCNGLQHLSALFRDETAAPHVNLCASSRDQAPADIYGAVAGMVRDRLGVLVDGGGPTVWAGRIAATATIDRGLCKGPVMVLPYGGTRGTIDDAVQAAILKQAPTATINGMEVCPWRECLRPDGEGGWVRDEEAVAGNYLAFRERSLEDHPLFRLDCQRLGGIVWNAIVDTLPRPIAAMKAFRSIAAYVKGRTLEWATGRGPDALWIVQAKAISASTHGARGAIVLPETVRVLKVSQGKDIVDPAAHRNGIIANFIHTQDGDHLARTMKAFGRPAFGAIHDCYVTRPSLMTELGRHTREAFYHKYASEEEHPLWQPVRLRDLKSGKVEAFPSWWALAEACKVDLPVLGSWSPEEVKHSAWFFS